MRVIGFDIETFPIAKGVAFPQVVCVSYDDGETKGVMLDDEGVAWFRDRLAEPDVILVAHNANYDIVGLCAEDASLFPLVRRALEEGRLRCTKVREKIIQNATGELYYEWDEETESWKGSSFTLQKLIWKHFKVFLHKEEDTWRMRYGLLYRVPIAEWPSEAIEYAISDSTWARALYLKQIEICDGDEIPGEMHVTRTSVALALFRAWGVRTDPEAVAQLKEEITQEYEFWIKLAQEHGLVRIPKAKKKRITVKRAKKPKKPKDDRSRDMKKIKARVVKLYALHGIGIPLTETGVKKGGVGENFEYVATDRETITFAGAESRKVPRTQEIVIEVCREKPERIAVVDVGLYAVAQVVKFGKLLSTYVPTLEHGVNYPITPDYNEMVETFRTSCSKPNLQNQGRGGGVRKCYRARKGYVYAFSDFDSLEMRTLAQTCIDLFGYSEIAEAIKLGRDLHVDMATETLGGLSYEEAIGRYESGDKIIEDVRQGSKIANYGMAGGMGVDSFIDYARGYGVEMTRERAVELHQAFRRRWRETVDYFNYCSSQVVGDDADQVVHPRTNMVRGKVRYTALCNFYFQHLAAIGATEAVWRVACEMFDPTLKSPLYGCRGWLFAHDEIGMEIPYAAFGPKRASEAALRLQTVMIEAMRRWVPDVPIGATVCMARRWFKGAKPVKVDGLLVPSKPEGKKWVADLDGLEGWEERAAA